MDDCLFCKIVSGQISCEKVFEDDNFMAFLDILPFTEGHTVIIPKIHYRWTYDVPNFGEYWEFTKKVSELIQKKLNPEFISYLTMGNEIPHAHIHLIPRYKNDVLVGLYKDEFRSHPTSEELQNTLNKITSSSSQL